MFSPSAQGMVPSPQLSNHITANIKHSMNDKGEAIQCKRKQEDPAQAWCQISILSVKYTHISLRGNGRIIKKSIYELIWHPSLLRNILVLKEIVQDKQVSWGITMDLQWPLAGGCCYTSPSPTFRLPACVGNGSSNLYCIFCCPVIYNL